MPSGYLKPRRYWPVPPTSVFDQTTKRERRRRWLPVTLDADFALDAEVEAICGHLAERVAEQPKPAVFLAPVEAVVDAVGGLCVAVAELVADTRLRGLDGPDQARARDALRVVTRNDMPTITIDGLVAGSWAEVLVGVVRPHTESLARLLGRQNEARRGEPTASDLVLDALRDLDRAALDLDRRIQKVEFWRSQRVTDGAHAGPDATQTARETLVELGVGASVGGDGSAS